MGSMLALLFAENGIDVFINDVSEASLKRAADNAAHAGLADRVHTCKDYATLCQQLGSPKVFVFSLPHGAPGDSVVSKLRHHLHNGDIVIDGSNENYLVTQTRQAKLQSRGVSYIGMGVSGGFLGARHGPSLMPGGDRWALDRLLPLLTKIAAKDERGRPCVTKIGTGGSGHYVKMIHNGIEHGMMSALCEAWEIMDHSLKMTGDEIGSVFDSWCSSGELVSPLFEHPSGMMLTFHGQKDNFLVSISGPICRAKNAAGSGFLLHDIRDAVVQDANDSEGTGMWANLEAMHAHVPVPSLSAAHYLRLASADLMQRDRIRACLGTVSPGVIEMALAERPVFLEHLRKALYAAILSCFIQGLYLLARADEREGWGINLQEVARIWRAGCIIKSDYITDLFERHYSRNSTCHPLCGDEISAEIKRCWPSLKLVTLKGLEVDAHVPCLGATLEYLKYAGSTDLPTNFMEAQLDSFGAHGFDFKTEPIGNLSKGMSSPQDLLLPPQS